MRIQAHATPERPPTNQPAENFCHPSAVCAHQTSMQISQMSGCNSPGSIPRQKPVPHSRELLKDWSCLVKQHSQETTSTFGRGGVITGIITQTTQVVQLAQASCCTLVLPSLNKQALLGRHDLLSTLAAAPVRAHGCHKPLERKSRRRIHMVKKNQGIRGGAQTCRGSRWSSRPDRVFTPMAPASFWNADAP